MKKSSSFGYRKVFVEINPVVFIMTEVILGLGSNIGDREKFLSEALRYIKDEAGEVVRSSSLWETEPWGFESEGAFINMAVSITTSLEPEKFLVVLHSIEERLGRHRSGKGFQSRTIDIDILFWGEEIIKMKELIIPHQSIAERRFVLVPLEEIAPDFRHPGNHFTVLEMLHQCSDTSYVRFYKAQL
jgi:2-amino-4-hydroxy-6-hydroxymethyldihydropteridine diphosphokinase